MTTLDLSHQRAVADLLQAERTLRQKSEDTIRAMRQALVETANRFDGKRLEALRRDNPGIPANWSALDWKRFFDEVPVPSQGWGSKLTSDSQNEDRYQKQIANLQEALRQAELDLERERARMVIDKSQTPESESHASTITQEVPVVDAIESLPPDATPALTVIIEDATRMRAAFPQKIPSVLSIALSGGQRTGGDLVRVFQRYWLILYLIGRWRLTASMEIEEALAGAVNVSAGSGSIHRVVEDLERSKVLITEIIELQSPRTALKLHRLSPSGDDLYRALFHTDAKENDWSRLIRINDGGRHSGHTLAVIDFSMHARKRGWATQVLPELTGTKIIPDVWVMRGEEKMYIEIEKDDQENLPQFCELSSFNNGRVALCAATKKSRARLVRDCKHDHLPGIATDLESLITGKFREINSDFPLWQESWE